MRLGLFGGTFDPPHLGHLAAAEACREAAALDLVLWIPAAVNPHKQERERAPDDVRLAMVEAAIEGNDGFAPSDVEIAREGVSYTVDTLRALARQHPEADLAWIVGGDSLASFATWREPREILRLAELIAYPRPGSDLSDVPGWVMERTTLIDAPRLDVSSTEIRARIAAGRTVRYLVPERVRSIIAEHGLYRTEAPSRG